MELILLCLFTAMYFDIAIFKKLDRGLFESVFQTPSQAVVWGSTILILAVGILSENRATDVPLLVLLTVLPLYLLRRHHLIGDRPLSQSYLVPDSTGGLSPNSLWLLSGALGVIIHWAYAVLVFGAAADGLSDLFPGVISQMGDLLLSAVFSTVMIVSLVYRAASGFSEKGFLANVGMRREGRPWSKVVFIPLALGLFFAVVSSYMMAARAVQPQTPLNDVLETTQSPGLILVFFTLALCIAPLIEEIVFRGYFFHVIRAWLGGKWAIYLIAAVFAVLHIGQYWGDWQAIAMVALLGLTLTALRAWTGTTIAGVVTHYIYNGGVTVIPIIFLALSNPPYFKYRAYFPYHDTAAKETLLKESLSRQPDLAEAYNDLAWLYAEEGVNLNEALQLIDKALSYDPDQPAYLDTKAAVLEKLGRFEEARPIREQIKEYGY